MKARAPRWPWVVVAVLLGSLACDPDPRPTRVYLEDFEELCDGAPCGWERSSGEPDQARWVETIHPGEHGLRLEGNVSIRGPAAPEGSAVATTPNLSARLAMRCDPGSSLQIDVVLLDELGTSYTATGVAMATEEWNRPTSVTLMSDGGATEDARVTGVVITKEGSGVCEVDELVIDDAGIGDDLTC